MKGRAKERKASVPLEQIQRRYLRISAAHQRAQKTARHTAARITASAAHKKFTVTENWAISSKGRKLITKNFLFTLLPTTMEISLTKINQLTLLLPVLLVTRQRTLQMLRHGGITSLRKTRQVFHLDMALSDFDCMEPQTLSVHFFPKLSGTAGSWSN